MAINLFCPTEKAVFLVGLAQGLSTPRIFPGQPSWEPGLHLDVSPREPIDLQLIARLGQELGFMPPGQCIDISQDFSEPIYGDPDSQVTTLYTGVLRHSGNLALIGWKPLPEILRNMPKDRRRLAYMKALQIQAGGMSQRTRAAELSSEDMANLNRQ